MAGLARPWRTTFALQAARSGRASASLAWSPRPMAVRIPPFGFYALFLARLISACA